MVTIWAHESAAQVNVPSGFVDEHVLDVGDSPATFAFAPDGRMFIGRRVTGELLVATRDGSGGWTLASQPFFTFDIPKDSSGDPLRHRSSGLRDIAFHPQFSSTPWVYAFFMRDQPRHNRVVRMLEQPGNTGVADAGSQQVVLDMPFNGSSSSGSHNGGGLEFGGDGKLYVTSGDGWSGGDPVQSLSTFTGKVFRLDADGSIPADNPFYAQAAGSLRAVYALGCRNPYSISVDPRDGTLFVNETTGTQKTHVFEVSAGANFGHQGYGGIGSNTSPFANADLSGSKLNTGGAWYVPSFAGQTTLPFPVEYHGSYFVAQWGSNSGAPGDIVRLRSRADPTPLPFASAVGVADPLGNELKPVLTRVGPDGALYYLMTTYSTPGGEVRRIRYVGGASVAQPRIDPTGGAFSQPVTVSIDAPDPNATIRFTLDGPDPDDSSPVYQSPFMLQEDTLVKARAFVGTSSSTIAQAQFRIGGQNVSPVAIAGPDFTWPLGQLVTLNGSASYDPDGDSLALIDNWTQIGGPALAEFDGRDFLSYFTPQEPGVYQFRLDVSDSLASSSDELTVTVVPCLEELLPGMVARWAFGEQSGDLAGDSSPAAAHGVVDGATWSVDAPRSGGPGSLRFDGSNDRVQVDDGVGGSGSAITLSLWFRPDGFGVSDARLFSKASGVSTDDHDLMLSTFGSPPRLRARLRVDGSTTNLVASSGTLATGRWQHAALVYDGQQLSLHLDGAEVDSVDLQGSLTFDPARKTAIGNQPVGAGSRPFFGQIDDVRIYGRALSGAELASLTSPTLGTVPSGCRCAGDLGYGTTDGPRLVFCREELAQGTFRVWRAPTGSPAVFVFGLTASPQQIEGVTLVPSPPALLSGLPVDSTGVTTLGPVGTGIGPISVVVQAIVADSSRPDGFAATNAIGLDLPF